MAFNQNIPQPGDLLSNSQGQLLANNGYLDAVFGIDHYTYSNTSGNAGKHNKITMPSIVGGVEPTVATGETDIYAIAKASVPIIDYSAYYDIPNAVSSVPTPLTNLQSIPTGITIANGATVNILNFTGLTFAFCTLYVGQTSVPIFNISNVLWTGATFQIGSPGLILTTQQAGNILQIKNNNAAPLANIFWTLVLHRVQ